MYNFESIHVYCVVSFFMVCGLTCGLLLEKRSVKEGGSSHTISMDSVFESIIHSSEKLKVCSHSAL